MPDVLGEHIFDGERWQTLFGSIVAPPPPATIPVAFVAAATFPLGTETTGGEITIPASTLAGHDIYLSVTTRGTALVTVTDNDTGGNAWVLKQQSGSNKGQLWWKKATAGTAGKIVTVTGAVDSCAGGLAVYSGGAAGDPTTNLSTEQNEGVESPKTHAGFTPASAGSMVCLSIFNHTADVPVSVMACTDPGTLEPERFERLSTGGSDCGVIHGSALQAAGPTATGNFTWTQSANQNHSIAWAIKPATGVVTPPGGTAPLRVGIYQWYTPDFGKGPGGDTGEPRYTATVNIPTRSGVIAMYDSAVANDILVFANLADGRSTWTDLQPNGTLRFNFTKYSNQIRRWTVAGGATTAQAAAVTAALAAKRFVIYLMDEPHHSSFGGSISLSQINQCGLLCKTIWPGCVVCVREDSYNLSPGPTGGWTGVDYGMSQHEGRHTPSYNPSIGRPFESHAVFFAREKADFAAMNLGMIPCHNWLDGGWTTDAHGINRCWDYLGNGSSSGLIAGTFGNGAAGLRAGQMLSCAFWPSNGNRAFSGPAVMQAAIDAAKLDFDAPAFLLWTHPKSNDSTQAPFVAIEARADQIAILDAVLNTGATRTTWNGWRTIK